MNNNKTLEQYKAEIKHLSQKIKRNVELIELEADKIKQGYATTNTLINAINIYSAEMYEWLDEIEKDEFKDYY